jgi:hypothetical protein
MTSAPMSDNSIPAKGKGPMPAISMTRTPFKGPIRFPLPIKQTKSHLNHGFLMQVNIQKDQPLLTNNQWIP